MQYILKYNKILNKENWELILHKGLLTLQELEEWLICMVGHYLGVKLKEQTNEIKIIIIVVINPTLTL